MKKILALLLTLTLTVTAVLFAIPASAAGNTYSTLVVLGDSISTGYGLSGTLYTRSSYANLLAKALGLSQGNGYVNYAVDGYTSANILAKAKANEATIRQADLIVMSNGGNDVLRYMLQFAAEAVGGNLANMAETLFSLGFLPASTVNERLYSEKNEATIQKALDGYRTNLQALTQYLRDVNPNARVVFLKQYNPVSGVPAMKTLDNYSADVIGRLNAIMEEEVPAGGCELADTYSLMVGNGMALSNILKGDIHPNALGHAKMFEALCDHLGIDVEAAPATTTTTSTTTTTATTTATTTTATATTVTTTAITTTATTTATITSATTTAVPPEEVTTTSPPVTTTTTATPPITTTATIATTTTAATPTTAPTPTTVATTATATATATTTTATTTTAKTTTTTATATSATTVAAITTTTTPAPKEEVTSTDPTSASLQASVQEVTSSQAPEPSKKPSRDMVILFILFGIAGLSVVVLILLCVIPHKKRKK